MKTMNPTRTGRHLRVALKHSALAAALGAWLAAGTALAAPPANDDIINAIGLSGVGSGQTGDAIIGTQTGTNNSEATLEVGEPGPGTGATDTVWFRWDCAANGTLTVSTTGSTDTTLPTPGEWDAVLGIYSGSETELTPLDSTPQDTGLDETMTLPVTVGTYYIQLAGYGTSAAANILLKWTLVPTNGAVIEAFGPGAVIGTVVFNAATIAWTVPYGTNPATLAPTFTLSPGATCTVGGLTVNSGDPADLSSPVDYTVTSSDSTIVNNYTVTATVAPPSPDCDITAFNANLAGSMAVITTTSSTTGTVVVTVPYGTTEAQVAALAPTYTLSAFATCPQPNPGVPSPDPLSLTTPVHYIVTAQSGAEKDYTVTVAEVADTFSVNFYSYGGLTTDEQKANVKVAPGMPAGLGDWYTSGWLNVEAPWGGGLQPSVTLTSNKASTATFIFKDCRNGWTYNGARTTLLGDGNGNMMDGHANSTLDPFDSSALFDMEVTGIPFDAYDVIFYIGANLAQFGDGTGVIKFNGGAERAFKLKPGAFDGTFTEMVDATTQGNYIVFTGVTGSSFTTQTWGTGSGGFNHVGPFGFQIRANPTPQAKIKTFGPGASIGPVVDNKADISWTVPNGTNPATLTPTFTLTDGATCTVGGLTVNSGDPADLSSPVDYTVTSSDSAIVNVYTVTVTVLPPFISPTPPPVTTDLRVWLTADNVNPDDPTQIRSAGGNTFVKQWNDLSGNLNNAANATESQQPQYIASTLNGNPVLRFAQVDDNAGSRLLLGDLSAQFGVPLPDPYPTAINSGTGGASIDGTYFNSPTRGVTGALVGDSDTAASFNGSNQNVDIPYSADLNSTVFSAEIWAKPATTIAANGAQAIFSSGEPVAAARKGWVVYCFGTASGNIWSFRPYAANGTNTVNGTSNGIDSPVGTADAGNWYHVVVVNDGTDCKLYVNGLLQSSYTPTTWPYVPGGAASGTTIGRRFGAGNQFNGMLDECAFYNTALSATDVANHYANGINPSPATPYATLVGSSNPVGYYRLDEPAAPAAGTQAATIFAVTTLNNDLQYSVFGNRSSNDERWVGGNYSEVTPGAFRGGRANFSSTYAQMPHTGSHIFAYESSPAAYNFLLNGSLIGTTTGDYNSGVGTNWVVGNNACNNGAQLNGDIAELIIYNRILSTAEADQVGAYLATKYGLSTTYGPPIVVSSTPPDEGTTAVTSDLVLTFSKSIAFDTGNITIKDLATPANDTVIPVDSTPVDGSIVSISGAVLTINPGTDLLAGKSYAVQIDATAIKDLTGQPFAGISDDTTWNFTADLPTDTTIAVTSSGSPTIYGDSVTFTATVDPIPSGGTVQFKNGVDALGTPVAVNTTTGVATVTTTMLGATPHEITAEYSGNYQFAGSTSASYLQEVTPAPLTVTALNTFRAPNTANPDPFPYQITGYQNGQGFANSGVTGTPDLSTDATLESLPGNYDITCALGSLAASNYSFEFFVNGTLTVAVVADTFSVNFYVGPDWPYGGLTTDEQKANVKVPAGVPAGLGDWYTSGWLNFLVPWAPTAPLAPVTLTSNQGSTATFTFKDCRNGWTQNGARTTLLGDGNGNMMDVHVNSTLDPGDGSNLFDMEVTSIPFAVYDVIFYIGANQAQYGDGKGVIVFNGGAESAFTVKPGAFDGTFTEMVDASTPGNYIVFQGVTGASFTTQTWGNGSNHLGPNGFQIRQAAVAAGFAGWASINAPGQSPGEDHDNDGVQNGLEYFMGQTGSSFTAMPGLDATNKVTWPKDPAYIGSWQVQTSPDLVNWMDVSGTDNGSSVSYTLPEGAGKLFVRLLVTPAP